MKLYQISLLTLVSTLLFTSSSNASDINAQGASFPKAVYHEWIEAYHDETGKELQYTPTGSGAGILSAVHRKSDFSGTDKPLPSWRLKRYKLKMFPTVIGSIVLAYNIPGVEDNALKLSESAIAAIFSGEATHWDDARIVKHNIALDLPHEPIKVAVRKDGSGTTYNFTYYLRRIDHKHFRKASKEFEWKPQSLISAKGSSGMTQQIEETEFSIGYVDYASKQKHHLTSATIQNRARKWVLPTLYGCVKGAQNAKMHKKNDFYDILAYKKGQSTYPIIAATFILLPDEPSEKNKEIIDFFDWAFSEGEYIANKHGFAMLPEKTIKEIRSYWDELLSLEEN